MTTEEVKKGLIDQGISQIQLAKQIGYSLGAVRNAISTGIFSFKMEFKIKELLKIS